MAKKFVWNFFAIQSNLFMHFIYMHLSWKPYIKPIYVNKVLGLCYDGLKKHIDPLLSVGKTGAHSTCVCCIYVYKYLPLLRLSLTWLDSSLVKWYQDI